MKNSYRSSNPSRLACALSLALFGITGCSPASSEMELCEIAFQDSTLTVPVARTTQQLRTGLMGKADPAPGMAFVWNEPGIRHLWMKDTPAPLSAAWIDPTGEIQLIKDMEPESLTLHSSYKPAIGMIEVPQGDFERLGVEQGDRIISAACFGIR